MNTHAGSRTTQTRTLEREPAVSIDELIEQTIAIMPEDRPPSVMEQMKFLQGYARICRAWTAEDIAIAKDCANKQMGFSTDGKNYSDEQYRDILTTATLMRARLVNQEVCVFSGKKGEPKVYRQKEYWRRRMFELEGFTNFSWAMGEVSVSPSGKCARVSASARWTYRGMPREIVLTKTEEADTRITVKTYETDSADMIIGKAESRLFAKVYAECTGSLWAREDAIEDSDGPTLEDAGIEPEPQQKSLINE